MKSNALRTTITLLAGLALAGCGQSPGDSPANMQNTNSMMLNTNSLAGAGTHPPATNNPPFENTNLSAGVTLQNTRPTVMDANGMNDGSVNLPTTNGWPQVTTNLPAGTNQ